MVLYAEQRDEKLIHDEHTPESNFRFLTATLGYVDRIGAGSTKVSAMSRHLPNMEVVLARKYSKSASKDVKRAVKRKKKGTLKRGKGGKGGKVKSRKQAIAIGLSEARKKGKKVPKRATKAKKAKKAKKATKAKKTRKTRKTKKSKRS
jgi:hypothetical protein